MNKLNEIERLEFEIFITKNILKETTDDKEIKKLKAYLRKLQYLYHKKQYE